MSNAQRYRRAMHSLRPSPAWRARTLETMEAARRRPTRHPVRWAVVAAVCAAAFLGGVWGSLPHGEQIQPAQTPGVARTPAPAATLSPEELWSLPDAGGWITIVEDPAQQMDDNPTEGRLDELTELPVYLNTIPTVEEQVGRIQTMAQGLGLTMDSYAIESPWNPNVSSLAALCQDGSRLLLHNLYNLTVTFAQPPEALTDPIFTLYASTADPTPWSVEITEDCNFNGSHNRSQTWYYAAPDASLEMQLFYYSFYRFRFSGSDTAQLVLPPVSSGTVCPIRTAEEAVALFRSGDYWSSMETAYPERADILQVTLEYATQPYQEYFQPVYRILFTQDYWADYLSAWMDEEADASNHLGVAVAYVPAVEGLNFQLYANDTELHRTPS